MRMERSWRAGAAWRAPLVLTAVAAIGAGVVAGPPPALPSGVAFGDVTHTSAVAWTRSAAPGQALFEWSYWADFSSIAGSATAMVTSPLLPVKVAITGVSDGVRVFVRVTDAAAGVAYGDFVTPRAGRVRERLRFGVSGDWRGELGPYPSITNAAGRDLSLFVELGDTVYADVPSPDLPAAQAQTLTDFRTKHAEVYSERNGLNAWADLRSGVAVLAMIDDHEVTNDFAGGAAPASDPRFAMFPGAFINETTLYQNGLQAFQEYNPIAPTVYAGTGDARLDGKPKLYRTRTYSGLAAFFMVDARSFRDQELPPVADPSSPAQIVAFLTNSFTLPRTMLGAAQLALLKQDLLAAQQAGTVWKFVVLPEPIQNLGFAGASDRYEGYAAERRDLLQYIDTNSITNVVFIAADIHGTLVNNLQYQTTLFGPQIETQAFEITTGPVAYDAPFGPTVIALAAAAGLLTPQQVAQYEALDRAGKDEFVRQAVDDQLTLLNYTRVGLQDATRVHAQLLQGGYAAVHTYGWTEFEISPGQLSLTVTTYGIDAYTAADLANDPNGVLDRSPEIVSRFVVLPVGVCVADLTGDGVVGSADLGLLLGAWGLTIDQSDLNGDGVVNAGDLAVLLGAWGPCP